LKLDTRALAYGVALAAGIAWIICSILVAVAPAASMVVSNDMFPLTGREITWGLTWGSFLVRPGGLDAFSGVLRSFLRRPLQPPRQGSGDGDGTAELTSASRDCLRGLARPARLLLQSRGGGFSP